MVLDGNDISCDRFGCRTTDTFDGALSPEDVRLRYHMLGWRFTETDGQAYHHCPLHLEAGWPM